VKKIFFLISLVFGLSSCVEILDDLTLNLDGSGTFKYNINLSSSKVKVNSILALDSLDGKKVPKLPEIKTKINLFKTSLAGQPGISNVKIETDYEQFIVKLSCDFTDVTKLQEGLKNAIASVDPSIKDASDYSHNWITWSGDKLERTIPNISQKSFTNMKQSDLDLLKTGSYTTVSRFAKTISKTDNTSATVSKSRTAVMLKANAYLLTKNPKILENTIHLNPK
jgi:hypothetical protein